MSSEGRARLAERAERADSAVREARGGRAAREARAGRPGRSLWTYEPVGRKRLPDPVRGAAVRAGLIVSFTLIEAMIALLGMAAGSWVAAPALLFTVVSTVAATWSVLDVWITRQVWNQRN